MDNLEELRLFILKQREVELEIQKVSIEINDNGVTSETKGAIFAYEKVLGWIRKK